MIVRKLLPIKAHFFLFMAALGPVLPQLQLFGKQLGISSVVMGTVTGILPFAYLLAKPLFGMIVDVYREYRKLIFMALIVLMALSYGCIIFIPVKTLETFNIENEEIVEKCQNMSMYAIAKLDCYNNTPNDATFSLYFTNENGTFTFCSKSGDLERYSGLKCVENNEIPDEIILETTFFWIFIILLSVGTIAFNVVNSISDAVCFDVIGEEYDYGKQRTWGSLGYGITALVSGYAMDKLPAEYKGYKSAVAIMLIFTFLDLISCMKLKLPVIPVPQNIWKDLRNLIKHRNVSVFLIFTIIAGIADGFLTYFLLWYVEDIARITGTENVKILEGLIIAAETFGGEILFFYIGDNILKKLGHIKCFSVCFVFYALRLGLISIVSSPWIIIIIEFLLQGPTYALTYLTIVAYANEIAPLGTSATVQGIAAGLDDGLGYAIGSLAGGILYRYTGARETFRIFCVLSLISGIVHYVLHFNTRRTENDHRVSKSNMEVNYVDVSQT